LSASHRGRRCLNLGQSMWGLWWTKWHEQVFLQALQFSPLRIIPPVLNIHPYLPVARTRSIKERCPTSFQKSMLIRKSGSTRHRSNFRFSTLQRLVRNVTSQHAVSDPCLSTRCIPVPPPDGSIITRTEVGATEHIHCCHVLLSVTEALTILKVQFPLWANMDVCVCTQAARVRRRLGSAFGSG
jgi:hypothetical protein